jgi:hypothetical protein
MGDLRRAGALWMMAGVTCVGLLLFVFVGEHLDNLGVLLMDPALPALVVGGAIVALLLGVLLIARPGPRVVRWSSVAGIPWMVVFGSLAIASLGGPGVVSAGLITVFGVAGALVANRSRMASGGSKDAAGSGVA